MTLESAFKFNASDLEGNARGELTPKQIELLQSYRKVSCWGTLIAPFMMLGSIGLLLGIVIWNSNTQSAAMQQALPIIFGVFGLAIAIFGIFWLLGIYRARHLKSGKISETRGAAHLHSKKQRYGTEYHVKIGDVRFQLGSKKQYEAFQADSEYLIYYIHYPPTHVILSVMSLRD